MPDTYVLRVPSCGRAGAVKYLAQTFPLVSVSVAVKMLRDRQWQKLTGLFQKVYVDHVEHQ